MKKKYRGLPWPGWQPPDPIQSTLSKIMKRHKDASWATFDPLEKFVKGYPKLAAKMDLQPELTILRSFRGLNTLNLLYMQAELVWLEDCLREQQEIDAQSEDSGERMNRYASNWYWLKESSKKEGDARKQIDILLEIRDILPKYNQAVLQQNTLLNLPSPAKHDITELQNFFKLNSTKTKPFLIGPDATIWGNGATVENIPASRDLITLHPRPQPDPVSSFAAKNFVKLAGRFLEKFCKPSKVYGVPGAHDTTVIKVMSWVTSIVASVVLMASIVVLYFVKDMGVRLGLMTGFNLVLTICLMGFTEAKKVDIFAVTAAFAAVQVVFVGTNRD